MVSSVFLGFIVQGFDVCIPLKEDFYFREVGGKIGTVRCCIVYDSCAL